MAETRRKKEEISFSLSVSEYHTECDLLEPIIILNSLDARLHDETERKREKERERERERERKREEKENDSLSAAHVEANYVCFSCPILDTIKSSW